MVLPIDNELVVSWLVRSLPPAPCGSLVIATGSGPYEEEQLNRLLRSANVETIFGLDQAIGNASARYVDVVIIGRAGWDKEQIDSLLNERTGEQIWFYSQEMFLSYWALGEDPFDDEAVARAFGSGHPALDYLSNVGFDWPSTHVGITQHSGMSLDAHEHGVLGAMKYSVAKKRALTTVERRVILKQVFEMPESHIRMIDPKSEVWGGPKTQDRLRMIAVKLASHCRNNKGKGNVHAVSRYEEDLAWLKKSFYTGRFTWPGTDVR